MPHSKPGPHFPLVRDLAVWDLAINALTSHRITDLLDLVANGQVLPLPPETDFVIEEDLVTLVRVRVTSGDQRGTIGWLPSSRLRHVTAA